MYTFKLRSKPAYVARELYGDDGVFSANLQPWIQTIPYLNGLILPVHLWIYLVDLKWYFVVIINFILVYFVENPIGSAATFLFGKKYRSMVTASIEVNAFVPMLIFMTLGFVSYLAFLMLYIFL